LSFLWLFWHLFIFGLWNWFRFSSIIFWILSLRKIKCHYLMTFCFSNTSSTLSFFHYRVLLFNWSLLFFLLLRYIKLWRKVFFLIFRSCSLKHKLLLSFRRVFSWSCLFLWFLWWYWCLIWMLNFLIFLRCLLYILLLRLLRRLFRLFSFSFWPFFRSFC